MGRFLRKRPGLTARQRCWTVLVLGQLALMAMVAGDWMTWPAGAGLMTLLAGHMAYRLGRLDGRKEGR